MTSSSKLSFVFCHGWAFGPQFWQPLQACFQEADCHIMDLGYEDAQDFIVPQSLSPDVLYIGVGHSLGLTKLLNLSVKFRALIGLQAFVDFLGLKPDLHIKRRRAWKSMCQNFQTQAQATLNQFYQTCFDPTEDQDTLSLPLISPKFERLNQDLRGLSESHSLPCDIPVLILGTIYDKIVPLDLIYDNFASVKNVYLDFYPVKGHCLGYHHSIIVAEKILNFVNDHA